MEPTTVMLAETGPEAVVPLERPLSDVLNNADRCDACGAQAFVWINMPESDAGLLYCAHHFNRFEEGLKKVAIDIFDERYKINVKPSQSSH